MQQPTFVHFRMQDLFICGTCQSTFNDLNQFVAHKSSPCQPTLDQETQPVIVQQHPMQTEHSDEQDTHQGEKSISIIWNDETN